MLRILHGFSEKEPMHSLIRKNGGIPYHRPFLTHIPLEFSIPSFIPKAILISSARTILYWGEWYDLIVSHRIAVYSIGQKTQAKLAAIGIKGILAGGTGDSLVSRVEADGNSSFVHIGAMTISKNLQAAFDNCSIPFAREMVYKSAAHPHFSVPENIDIGCLNSERCARIWASKSHNIPVVCIGESTKKEAMALGLRVLGTASRPNREELVRVALQR